MEESEGDVAGLKSATVKFTGDYAYGTLRTETGIHRLVRKSPFDSNARRHTSASPAVFVFPEVDDSIEININPADVRTDTYRASGAGGQHINKTDSAVRLTPRPDRHRRPVPERPFAAPQPRRSLADAARPHLRVRNCASSRPSSRSWKTPSPTSAGATRSVPTCWDQSRIKDLRTNYEVGNTQGVLDGDLDRFHRGQPETGRLTLFAGTRRN